MAYIKVKRPWTTQPQRLVPLDTSRPLNNDLVLAYSTGRGPHDAKHDAGVVTGSMSIGAGAKGRFIQPADANSYLGFADNVDYNVVGDITVIALIKTGSVASQQGIITKTEGSGGFNTPFGLFIESGGAISLNRANTGVSPFRVWASSTSLSASQTVVIAVTQVAEISTAPQFYLNGIIDTGSATSLYSGNGFGAATSNTTPIRLGNRSDLASRFLGELYDGFVYKRVLSAKEIEELSRNIWSSWQAREIEVWIPAAGAGVTVALSGLSLSSARGNLTPNNAVSLSGQSVTSARGSLSPATSIALSGQSLTGSRGSFTPSTAKALSGLSLTGSVGTLSPATQIALTGQSLTSAKGTLSVSGTASAALTGQSLTTSQGTLSPSSSSSVALTGQALTSTGGALSPSNAVTLSGQYVTSAQGSVAVSTAIALSGQSVSIAQGSLAIVGDVSIQLSGLQLSIDVGDLAASTGAISSIVERTAIFRAIVERTATFRRTKTVTVRFN